MAPRRVIFLGPPGAGKGTHASWLAEHAGFEQLSTGDMLRAAIRDGRELGQKAKAFMDAGKLVPDDVIIDMLFERMDADGGWILDGFPRTLPQALALDERLDASGEAIDLVVLFEVTQDELVARLSSRLTCSSCGHIYNRRVARPKVLCVCDQCGGEVVQRPDDRVEAVTERLAVYAVQTSPLVNYYTKAGKLARIDGDGEVEAIRDRIRSLFDRDS